MNQSNGSLSTLIKDWESASASARLAFEYYLETGERDGPPAATLLVKEDQLYLTNRFAARRRLCKPRQEGFRTVCTADEWAFARCFRHVWGKIPRENRKAMLSFWRPCSIPPAIAPLIEIVDDDRIGSEDARSGLFEKFFFRASLTTIFRDRMAFVIAHELAAASRRIVGGRKSEVYSLENEQKETDDVARDWGFPRPDPRCPYPWEAR
jgi:hypothetical protein